MRVMSGDAQKLLDALRKAEQIEIDGKAWYLKLAEASVNTRGRALFRLLAAEEDVHREDFRRIYEAARDGREAPASSTAVADCTRLRHLFSQSAPDLEAEIKATSGELEAIETAVRMEQGGLDHYRKLAAGEKDPATRRFYQALIRQEESHKSALLDYKAYVTDPEGWLVSKGGPSPGACFLPGAVGGASEAEW
jgi:rubrerythrin